MHPQSTIEKELRQYLEKSSQHTLKDSVKFTDVGIHSGEPATIIINPAPINSGITFVRSDVKGLPKIKALWKNVSETRLCTTISNGSVKVSTIEHLMSALSACQIDNALITIDNEEVPIIDGSAKEFTDSFVSVGIESQPYFRKELIILEEVEIRRGNRWVKLAPNSESKFSFEIDFDNSVIEKQYHKLTLNQEEYAKNIAAARTFGFYEEITQLKKLGFAKGGSLSNAIVVSDDKILNEEGLRFPNEFVRHKLLDAIGDMYLAGCPIRGEYVGNCSGHAMNNQLLRLLFQDPSSFCYS